MIRTMRAALAASAIALGCSVVVPSSALTIDPGLFSSPSRPLQRLVPGRECSETQNLCTLRATVNFSDGSIGSGIWAFTLPQSAYVLSIDADVTTAFNAGTTNNITIGATATGTDFLPSTSVSSAGIQHLTSAAGLGATATGNASLQTQLNGAVPVYFRYQQSGTAATAGSVTVVISYAPAFGDKVTPVASGGGSLPAFVAATCGASFPSTGICADLVSSATPPHVIGGQVWDGVAQATVTPASLMTDTRSATVPYDPGTSITTAINPNTLPVGSAGLQNFVANVNLQKGGNGDYTANGWATSNSNVAAPTITKNPFFGTTGCTAADMAPDGSCNTTEITFPALGANMQSAVQLQVCATVCTLTAGTTYTFYVWLKNSAATANPQTYLNVQEGATPFAETARKLVQPGAAWQRFPLTFTVPAGFTSMFVEIGNCSTTTGVNCQQGQLGGGTMEAWVSQTNPGTTPGPFVLTTTAPVNTPAIDNIVTTGNLAAAIPSAGAISVTTQGAGNGIAGTMLDSNGTVLLGRSAGDNVVTALGATLTSKALGNFSASETAFLSMGSGGGSINLNGTPVVTDATVRTPAAPFHIGTTGGASATLNGFITAIAVYPPSAVSPPLVASAPITGVSIGTIATISSGTLGNTVSTFVNGDSWNVTEDAAGHTWQFCNDCGYGTISSANANGNVILSEASYTPGASGNPGFLSLGNPTGGPPGLVNAFNANLGTFSTGTGGSGVGSTWKSCGIIAITDGANTDLFAGLDFDLYAPAAPWIQTTSAASIASVVAANAGTSSAWNGLAPNPPVLPISSPTFTTQQFGSPCFIQYAPGYVNSTLPTPNPDNSGSFLYAISNDGGWNGGSNIYLARIPLATILSQPPNTGSLAAASVAANWQFYISTGCSGGDGTNNACWTSALTSATPIFTLANKLGRASMTYLPTTNRYEISTWVYPTTNGPTRTTQTQPQMSATSQFEYIDCAKPWSCTGVVSTIDFATQGFYNPVVVPPSLALDGGFTATEIFTGNFNVSGNAPSNFSPTAVYTPTMGQVTFRY